MYVGVNNLLGFSKGFGRTCFDGYRYIPPIFTIAAPISGGENVPPQGRTDRSGDFPMDRLKIVKIFY